VGAGLRGRLQKEARADVGLEEAVRSGGGEEGGAGVVVEALSLAQGWPGQARAIQSS
jgi:hypothetical protein